MGVRNAISLKYAFEINPVSIRTFKGCNVVWFTVLEKTDLRLKVIWCPPPSWCSPVLSSANSAQVLISQEEFWNYWGTIRGFSDMAVIYLLFLVSDHTTLFLLFRFQHLSILFFSFLFPLLFIPLLLPKSFFFLFFDLARCLDFCLNRQF